MSLDICVYSYVKATLNQYEYYDTSVLENFWESFLNVCVEDINFSENCIMNKYEKLKNEKQELEESSEKKTLVIYQYKKKFKTETETVNENIKKFIKDVKKPIPLQYGKLAPVEWYYSLFTEEELKESLSEHDSKFPTKYFLTFKSLKPIILGTSEKVLVGFIPVNKDEVDNALKKVIASIKK